MFFQDLNPCVNRSLNLFFYNLNQIYAGCWEGFKERSDACDKDHSSIYARFIMDVFDRI